MDIRRLGEESSHNTLLGILKSEVVVGATLVGNRLALVGIILKLWVSLFEESKPSGQVRKSIASNKSNSNLVAP